jgi:hypothetical protein
MTVTGTDIIRTGGTFFSQGRFKTNLASAFPGDSASMMKVCSTLEVCSRTGR